MPDDTLNHPAVKAYRDAMRLGLNLSMRLKVIEVVGEDLELWQQVLDGWWYWKHGSKRRRNPLDISGMLSELEYERRQQQKSTANTPSGHNIGSDHPDFCAGNIPAWGRAAVQSLRRGR